MIQQQNNPFWNKCNGLIRYILVHCFTGIFPFYIVNEYPKSGGSWFAQMMSKMLGVPFPRNRLPMLKSSILHGHYLQPWNMKNVVVVWRDGRDVLVSQYFHSLFNNEIRNASYFVNETRKILDFSDYDNIQENLPRFIEYSFKEKRSPRFSWSDFVDRWHGHNCAVHVNYEALRSNTADELFRVVNELTGRHLSMKRADEIADEFSFIRQSGRKPGEEKRNSFLRKGIVGDWKNCFTQEACELFASYAGPQLIKLGYEKDNSWVHAKDS